MNCEKIIMENKLKEIKKAWVCKQQQGAAVGAWDTVSKEYADKGLPDFKTDGFLKVIDKSINLTREMTSLDVGCGAGIYSLALAFRLKHVTGVDFSPEMIKLAKRLAQKYNLKNTEFRQFNWLQEDASYYKHKYDVVYAHNTPALADYETLKKIIDSSKRYCFIEQGIRRIEPILDKLSMMLGTDWDKQFCDEVFLNSFETLWAMGYEPYVTYRPAVWSGERLLEKAIPWYISRLEGGRGEKLDPKSKQKVIDYLSSISRNGNTREEIHNTTVTIFWEV
ncbi:MAG: methyltransferase domain-containing protein [Eubacteriales bacterium]